MNEQNEKSTVKKILNKLFWTCHLNFIGFNFVKMQANGFCVSIHPAIEEIYKDDPDGKAAAYTRHQEFFNTHTIPFAFIVALVYALEKKYKEDKDFDVKVITDVKVALMGPTAGMFDSLIFNGLRIIAAGVGIGIASTGNFLGVLLFILLYGVTQSVLRYFMVQWGYSSGETLIDEAFSTGLIEALQKAVAVLGLMMTGALTAAFVKFPLNWTINISGAELVVQDVIDSVFPGLLSIVLVFVLARFLRKGVKPTVLILGLIAFALLGAAIGIF